MRVGREHPTDKSGRDMVRMTPSQRPGETVMERSGKAVEVRTRSAGEAAPAATRGTTATAAPRHPTMHHITSDRLGEKRRTAVRVRERGCDTAHATAGVRSLTRRRRVEGDSERHGKQMKFSSPPKQRGMSRKTRTGASLQREAPRRRGARGGRIASAGAGASDDANGRKET